MIKINKDFLNKEQFNELKNTITSDLFPWFYQEKMTETKNNNENKNKGTHPIYPKANAKPDVFSILFSFEQFFKSELKKITPAS